jgi:hypothetical protein
MMRILVSNHSFCQILVFSIYFIFFLHCGLNFGKNEKENNSESLLFAGLVNTVISLNVSECNQVGLRYSTELSQIPVSLQYTSIGFAKEIIQQQEKLVVISGGNNPIPLSSWDTFSPSFPYAKNIDRNLLFQKTAFYRSPGTSVNCTGSSCFKTREYRGYTWLEIAQSICVIYTPSQTNILKPDEGFLAIKPIKKCQGLRFEDSIYQLTDGKGNFYVMHATETGSPTTEVSLPSGWTIKKISLTSPLIITPFGGGNECYFNIVGDHLGQGYHQYIYANSFFEN